MNDKKIVLDGSEFSIALDEDTGTLHILWRDEVFTSISIPILAACAQAMLKRMEAAKGESGKRQ